MRRVRVSQLTIRARLALVYGGLFLFAGVLLLAASYLLIWQQTRQRAVIVSGAPGPGSGQMSPPVTDQSPGVGQAHRLVAEGTRNALHTLLTQGGIALAVIAAVTILIGWLIGGRMLQPLQKITETARRIAEAPAAGRGLHERIALRGPADEMKRLADTFDLMLERLDHSFDGQRRFIANASHELRTPLTLNRALIEVAVHRRAVSDEVRQLGETLLEINTRQERLIDGLLLLARSERELTDRSFVDLADVVEHVTANVPAGTVTVHTDAREAPTTGNPVLLERLVQNLVDNGVRHNAPGGGWVRVTCGTRPDGGVVLTVSNTGRVVPPYEVPGLFEPFRRLDADRLVTAPGAGLGLSIVRAVARAHGGDVRATPRDGGGLVVTVTLPEAAVAD